MTERDEQDLEALADIIWWIKGYNAGVDADGCADLDDDHLNALRRARIRLMPEDS